MTEWRHREEKIAKYSGRRRMIVVPRLPCALAAEAAQFGCNLLAVTAEPPRIRTSTNKVPTGTIAHKCKSTAPRDSANRSMREQMQEGRSGGSSSGRETS